MKQVDRDLAVLKSSRRYRVWVRLARSWFALFVFFVPTVLLVGWLLGPIAAQILGLTWFAVLTGVFVAMLVCVVLVNLITWPMMRESGRRDRRRSGHLAFAIARDVVTLRKPS